MTKRRFFAAVTVLAIVAAIALPTMNARGNGNPHMAGVVYVSSQGLFYDTFVPTDLPPKGRFQKLEPGAGPLGASLTEFGPGDPGYIGGRWWVDVNGNDEMDSEDLYVLCPLMGPGYEMP